MQSIARSSAARQAVKEFKARRLPRASAETEKTLLARYAGRPNDEDLVMVVPLMGSKDRKDRWDLIKAGVALPMKSTVLLRNEVEFEPEKSSEVAKSFQLIANTDTDSMIEFERACARELMKASKVYFLDSFSVGVAKFARVNCAMVTDHPATARILSQVIPRAPRSSQNESPLESRVKLFHSATRDDEASVESYLTFSDKKLVARGVLPQLNPLLDSLLGVVAPELRGRGVVAMKGNAYLDESTGDVTLALGEAGAIQDSAFKGMKLQGAGHIAWGAEGVSRVWEGRLDNAGFTPVQARSSMLPHPKNIVFAGKGSSPKKVSSEDVSTVFTESASLQKEQVDSQLFTELVQSFGVSVQQLS